MILLHFVKKQSLHSRNPCAVKLQSGINKRISSYPFQDNRYWFLVSQSRIKGALSLSSLSSVPDFD